ncbi:cytochrome P450 [Neobacillus massiliamazoniensis]|uniref:Monooxygenase n=1 Tax=Neobacillus massiliamazoniensis TaxID=1499688 RepID=A0A0U1P3T5_9BACI|nr:cytochrome P450 [Neobacillus massiliamazoniensis]CRK84793.1 monooxygenase [Neobacillus massiliamazoniensis]
MDQRDILRVVTNEFSGLHTKEEKYNPFPWYKNMREKHPVYYDSKQGVWNVFLYEDAKRVISDKDAFSSKKSKELPLQNITNIDPPDHTRLRSLVSKAFTPKIVANWEPRIQDFTKGLLDQISKKNTIDIVEDLAYPLPVMVIAELLGIPTSDRNQFKEWSNSLVAGPSSTEDIQETINQKNKATSELKEYFSHIIQEKRKKSLEDIISVLIQAEENEGKLSAEELLSFCIVLLVAGNETTTNLISNAVYSFVENKTVWETLKQDPTLIPNAVEETLRYRSPVQVLPRRVKMDTEISGYKLTSGQLVFAWIGSANRDENKFSNPEYFDLKRNPNDHLTFGKGIHFCLGAPLARLEAKIALSELIKRYSTISIKEGYQIDPIESSFMNGLKSLPVIVE